MKKDHLPKQQRKLIKQQRQQRTQARGKGWQGIQFSGKIIY